MELSLILALPSNEKMCSRVINESEMDLQKQGFTILYRQIHQDKILIVYENHLTVEQTEQVKKEQQAKTNYSTIKILGKEIPERAVLIVTTIVLSAVFWLLKILGVFDNLFGPYYFG